MKHTCFLFIGEEFADVAKGHMRYLLKYASANTVGYLTTMSMLPNDNNYDVYEYEQDTEESKKFKSDIDAAFAVKQKKICEETNPMIFCRQAGGFLHDLFTEKVTLMMPGDGRMSLCIITSAQTSYMWIIKAICEAIRQMQLRIDVDVLVYPHLGDVTQDSSVKYTLKDLEYVKESTHNMISMLKEEKSIRQIFMMQDKNQRGITISFSFHNLVAILGEFAIACVENYNQLFPPAMLYNKKEEITTFGISQLTFDRYFYVQYLLRLAFIQMMQREKVDERDIDVNHVADIAKKCLMKHPKLLTEFYNKYIDSEKAGGETDEVIITDIASHLKEFIKGIKQELLSYIEDESLSLPEKRCVLAMVLGEDDSLIVGELYDKELVSFLDHYREPVNLFVNYNNSNITQLNDEEGKPLTDRNGKRITVGGVIDKSVDDAGFARFDLDELKRLRLDIRQTTSYIRMKEEELAKLDVSRIHESESDKVITSDGFVFGGNVYKLIPDEPVIPVNETYKPVKTHIDNINLSPHFAPIKNQGNIGSCSAHAVVAIIEYILKKNRKTEFDLSERFVYYNVRKNTDKLHLDSGVSMYDVIKSVEEQGICLETLCPYNIERFNVPPSEEAYADGQSRRVMKAMNIPIGADVNENIDALRSALSDGYPIAFGMRIFESFKGTDGFIMLPSEEEIASAEKSNHAMVICGYNDEQKYFLVRNSWGEKFGIDGYCYVPYAYLGDSRLIHGAYIITEVNMEGIQVKGVVEGERFSFNSADTHIKAAVIGNMITEEKNKLKRLTKAYRQKRRETEELIQQLVAVSTRDQILKKSKDRLNKQISQAVDRKDELAEERGERLAEYERQTSKGYLKLGLTALGLLLVNFVWSYNWWRDEPLYIGTHTYTLCGLLVLCILTILAWRHIRYYGHKHLREDLDKIIDKQGMVIGKLEAERDGLKSRFHVAGMMMTELNKLEQELNEYYRSARNYVSNLSTWYHDEKEHQNQMEAGLTPPFEMVFDENDILTFFDQNKDSLLNELRMYHYLSNGDYQLGAEAIIQFQKKLQKHILNSLNQHLDGFCIYDYILRKTTYPYLPKPSEDNLKKKLARIDAYATPFVQLVNASPDMSCNITIMHPENDGGQGPWNEVCATRPNVLLSQTPWSMTMIKIAYAPIDNITLLA